MSAAETQITHTLTEYAANVESAVKQAYEMGAGHGFELGKMAVQNLLLDLETEGVIDLSKAMTIYTRINGVTR
jgi:hypothetical protein